MTSPDRAPDDPPETSVVSRSHAAASPISVTNTHPPPPFINTAFHLTGVSPTSTPAIGSSNSSSRPLPPSTNPGTWATPTPLTTSPNLTAIADTPSPRSRPLFVTTSPLLTSPFSVSPAQLTPLDSVLPITPTATTTSAPPNTTRHKYTPPRPAATAPGSAVDQVRTGISFPDNSMTPHFEGPSSAPPTPSVISVTHPSQFIHTHHPRRGSLTPLGLNVISPVPPPQAQTLDGAPQQFPIRSVGFNRTGGSSSSDAHYEPSRRDSVASTASNITATRPSTYAMSAVVGASSSSSAALFNASRRRSSLTPSLPNLAPPPNFNAKRRSSLTPSLPTLAAPSPTRALAAGRLSARPPSDGGFVPSHSRTMDSISSVASGRRASAAAALFGGDRRGSLPHLYYGAWTGPGTPTTSQWSPTLPTQRGSVDVDDTATIDQSFKFGCPPAEATGASPSLSREDDTASGSPQRVAQLSSASARRKDMSAFELAEQQEADRQRRAFLAATYGEDSRRARARLSLGGTLGASPGSPASTRRQSLLLWERINKPGDGSLPPAAVSAAAIAAVAAATAVPAPMLHQTLDDLGRRPSLPINIPMRTPPTHTSESFDDQSIWDNPDSIDLDDTPVRPLPPLLPLSDPVPRLLPSTLALHRATHLLNARGVSSEPLPAPLPPSLHPPAPVDLSEFDIDFILAGSRSNLGRQGSTSSSKRPSGDATSRNGSGLVPGGGHGIIIGEEEDSFAKFVGAFDDEYGGRRGDWTFRACVSSSSLFEIPGKMDDFDTPGDSSRPRPRAEWDCPGAGKFEIYANGDVRSVESGAVWRIRKSSAREFEFEQPLRIPQSLQPSTSQAGWNPHQPLVIATCGGYTLASKLVHTENGGVKLPFNVQRELKAKGSRVSRRVAARSRQSMIAPELEPHEQRTKRIGSEDSGATAIPIAAAVVHNHFGTHQLASSVPPRTHFTSPISPTEEHHHHPTPKEAKRLSRGRKDRDKEDDDKHKRQSTFGGVFKRGLFRAHSLVKEYEERNKERHLLTNGSGHNHHGYGTQSAPVHGSSRHSPLRPSPTEREHRSETTSYSSQHSSHHRHHNLDSPDDLADWPEDAPFGSLGLGIEDEQNGGQPWKEGKAWSGVPEEALAMVIPIESDAHTPPLSQASVVPQPFINPFFVDGPRQALLVWFTPFNANNANNVTPSQQDLRSGSSSTLFKITESPHHEETSPQSTSLRLPKLLRPRGHKADPSAASPLASSKTIPIPPPTTTPPNDLDLQPLLGDRSSRRESRNFPQLPFQAFRVVAKVVNTEDLKSEPEVPVIALEQWTEQMRTGKPAGLHTPPLEGQARMEDPGTGGSTPLFAADSPAFDDPVLAGRAFPTVIAVCHSRTAGVEFVLEGLDRLGLCKGGDAWGPTGYEEWRGTGLSENGRQALDLLWTACTAVMGL